MTPLSFIDKFLEAIQAITETHPRSLALVGDADTPLAAIIIPTEVISFSAVRALAEALASLDSMDATDPINAVAKQMLQVVIDQRVAAARNTSLNPN